MLKLEHTGLYDGSKRNSNYILLSIASWAVGIKASTLFCSGLVHNNLMQAPCLTSLLCKHAGSAQYLHQHDQDIE